MRKLFLDTETAPSLGYFYGRRDLYVSPDQIVHNGFFLCFQAALDDGPVFTQSLRGLGQIGPEDDKPLVERMVKLIESADVVIAHNADRFDLARLSARLASHGMKPFQPPAVVDTLKACRRFFRFEANSLDSVCQELGIDRKFHSGGFETSLACMRGEESAWEKLISYGIKDVELLRDLYKRILPWISNHPNENLYNTSGQSCCPKCGSLDIEWRGTRHTQTMSYARFRCRACGGWGSDRKNSLDKEKKEAIVKNI